MEFKTRLSNYISPKNVLFKFITSLLYRNFQVRPFTRFVKRRSTDSAVSDWINGYVDKRSVPDVLYTTEKKTCLRHVSSGTRLPTLSGKLK